MTDLSAEFFLQDALIVAPRLLGCRLTVGDRELTITETEAYRGESDTACHAHHGRTKRTEMLYRRGGHVYVYLCYGIHSLLNIITEPEDEPQGVLIRCCQGAEGPGKLTKTLGIDLPYNGLDILTTDRISLWKGRNAPLTPRREWASAMPRRRTSCVFGASFGKENRALRADRYCYSGHPGATVRLVGHQPFRRAQNGNRAGSSA